MQRILLNIRLWAIGLLAVMLFGILAFFRPARVDGREPESVPPPRVVCDCDQQNQKCLCEKASTCKICKHENCPGLVVKTFKATDGGPDYTWNELAGCYLRPGQPVVTVSQPAWKPAFYPSCAGSR